MAIRHTPEGRGCWSGALASGQREGRRKKGGEREGGKGEPAQAGANARHRAAESGHRRVAAQCAVCAAAIIALQRYCLSTIA